MLFRHARPSHSRRYSVIRATGSRVPPVCFCDIRTREAQKCTNWRDSALSVFRILRRHIPNSQRSWGPITLGAIAKKYWILRRDAINMTSLPAPDMLEGWCWKLAGACKKTQKTACRYLSNHQRHPQCVEITGCSHYLVEAHDTVLIASVSPASYRELPAIYTTEWLPLQKLYLHISASVDDAFSLFLYLDPSFVLTALYYLAWRLRCAQRLRCSVSDNIVRAYQFLGLPKKQTCHY